MSDLRLMEIRPVGDSALIVQLGEAGGSEPLLENVLRVQRALQQADLAGVVEITTAFRTVAVFYDPLRVPGDAGTIFASLEALIRAAIAGASSAGLGREIAPRTLEIPVCYDREFALDLGDVADAAGLQVEEVIRLHASAEYQVACVGFALGFPYLLGLPAELALPRRATPRTAVPPGSVAIGGSQAGIYAIQSPGGWHVIGRTPLQLFDVGRETPSLLRAGDHVRFQPISREQFEAAVEEARPTRVQVSAKK